MRKISIIRLRGGFGNQLFQYLNAALSVKNKKDMILVDLRQIRWFHDTIGISALKLNYKRTKILTETICYILNSKYFKKIQSVLPIYLIEDININEESISKILDKKIEKIELEQEYKLSLLYKDLLPKANEVVVHVRLGDMFKHGLSSAPTYFLTAMKLFREREFNEYLIYTDDILIFEEHYVKLLNSLEVNYRVISEELIGAQLFTIFSESPFFIGSNSSLSLISALLNENRHGLIILPNFGSGIDLKSISSIPENWIVI